MKRSFLMLLLGMLLIPVSAFSQERKITGVVVDVDGVPLPGVGVVEDGTMNGTVTDAKGVFTLQVNGAPKLVFSSLGFKTQEYQTGRMDRISVVLEEDRTILDEVVVVGFATQKKVNLTGSVSTMDSKAFEAIPVQNAVQALQGKVPGLVITESTGQLNARSSMSVRGLATIGEGSYASTLVLIDGMEGDLHTLNPQDIEDISVLKDAAASSIYGSRAPFGVILVTTKQGKSGKTVVNYNNNFRFNTPINLPRQSDSWHWAHFFNDASNNAGQGDWILPDTMQRIRDYMDGLISYNTVPRASDPKRWEDGYGQANDNIDYYRVLYDELTFEQEHNVSASGGNDKVSFYVSGNFLDQEGKMNWGGDGLRRYNLSGKIQAQLAKWAQLGYNARFSRIDYHQPTVMIDDMFFCEIGRQSWPIGPLYDPNGNLYNDHVLRMRDAGQIKQESSDLAQQVSLKLTPLKGWEINGEFNYRLQTTFGQEYAYPVHNYCVDGISVDNEWYRNYTHENSDKTEYYNVNAYTSYEKTFADSHYMKVMAGFQMENNNYRYSKLTKYGLVVPGVTSVDSATGLGATGEAMPNEAYGDYFSWSTMGFFGRLNYNYKERYLVEANFRYDGSSRFRKENRWGFFPSVSVGWNIANEPFMEQVKDKVNILKIRASYGSLGNQYTSSYYPTYAPMGYQFNKGTWLINNAMTNTCWYPGLISTSLSWETINSLNVGLDGAFFDNRLTASFDYFVRRTLNMVGPSEELPVILGTSVPVANNTDLETRGFELEIGWRDQLKCGFSYGARFVLSDAQGTITRYSNPSGTLTKYYKGMKWGEIWGYESLGIARTQEEMDAHIASMPNGGQNVIGLDWRAGDVMYVDRNGDGKVDAGQNTIVDHGDLTVIGNTTPRYNFGLDLTAEWKGIDLRIFLQGTGKREYFQNSFYFWGCGRGVWWSMSLKEHEDYFRDDPNHPLGLNLDAYYPRPIWNTEKNRQVSSYYLQDASYIRLKNLQVGYTIPPSITRYAGISKLRIYFSGENLATFTKMSSIFDPETIGTSMGSSYPLSRIYSFGLSVTF